MATKNKEAKGVVAATPEIQEAQKRIERAQTQVSYALYYAYKTEAFEDLRSAQTWLSSAASHLRRLLEASKRGRAPSTREVRAKPARRKMVASNLQIVSSIRARPPKARTRKRVARKPTGKEFFHNINLPH